VRSAEQVAASARQSLLKRVRAVYELIRPHADQHFAGPVDE